eukprot:CAMPEP_0197869188 /NCGR_PEP_ID=MMETSP1439-20131203/24_1 /TAXON_ID=66791 /ORGANISM="Gonyaulax spinifera, Strain CCMP409" /LENGTH=168 /DNA_ID=CAMNT_0043487943 /DNA_START=25 /DNA_END=531 /DNA_ORIENTATION=+
MKPAWDKLMKEYKDSKDILIADVDCTTGGKDLCEEVGVKGFPTIKYGDPNNLEDYEGGRDLEELQTFAKENLGASCGPKNPDLCDAEKKKQLDEFMAMSDSDLEAEIEKKDGEMKKAEADLEELLKSLQAQYEAGTKAKDDKKKEIKESGLGLMKSVLAYKKTSKSEL